MKRVLLVALALALFAVPVGAQTYFGKNVVNENGKPGFYQSEHFDVYYYGFDLTKPDQEKHFKNFVGNIEGGYRFLRDKFNHDIERRIPVAVYSTHSKFEAGAAYVTGQFLSEGTGAFVEHLHRRMYTKEDLLPPIRREANIHELVHEFQIDIMNPSLIQRVIGSDLPNGFIEGGAEFVASLYMPLSLDNVRKVHQRIAASNRLTLPTWEQLVNDQVNGYTMWMMVFQMLENRYGKGLSFQIQGLKARGAEGLGALIYDLTQGQLGNPSSLNRDPQKFDQGARDYWYDIYGEEANKKPRPYQETENVKSRSVTPGDNPYEMLLACQSPNGKRIVAFTVQKGLPALISYSVPEEYLYAKEIKVQASKEKDKSESKKKPEKSVKNLTPQMPPIPWEYLIIQGFETWPFNGSDAACSVDGKQIAFFARSGRDHALFIIDAEKGKILKKAELPVDQAFSPSFTPNGKYLLFSAAKNITRDIYNIDLTVAGTKINNLTNDERFDTAPSVSPDGTRVAYVGSDGDFQHLFLMDVITGEKTQLTFGRFNDSSPSWSEDGARLVYVSDAKDNIWNLYTFDLATRVSSQWTDYFGQVLVPIFVKGQPDKVYYTVYWDEDQFKSTIYPNFEIYEVTLKKPISQEVYADNGQANEFSFQPYRSLFNYELDKNQLANKVNPPENWKKTAGDVNLGTSTWYGTFASSYIELNNLLGTKQHLFRFASYGDVFRILDYGFYNQENRLARAYSVSHQKFPLYYMHYDAAKQYPEQIVLRSAQIVESSVGAFISYPTSKFSRWEAYSRIRHRDYNLFGLSSDVIIGVNELEPGSFNSADFQLARFFENAGGSSLSFGGAYVRDTTIHTNNAQGPYHGNALRLQFEAAPPAGKVFDSYTSASLNARVYRKLIGSSLFAGRVDAFESSRANGDFILMCGPDMLRGCAYGSMVGNRVAYASAELRFPVIDALALPGRMILGPVRGLLFADAGIASFSDERFPAQRGTSLGFGVQYLPFNVLWTRSDSGKWIPTFYLRYNW